MSNLYDAAPSSLRKPIGSQVISQYSTSRPRSQSVSVDSPRVALFSKSRLTRLPQEPEDARLTGVTRSLQRRLLALNVRGSLLRSTLVLNSRIA